MRYGNKIILLAGLCACLVLPAQVKADSVIFSNLGPFVSPADPGFNPFPSCQVLAAFSCGALFTSPGDFQVTQLVQPRLSHGTGPGALPIPAFTLYTSVDGKPGEVLDRFGAAQGGFLGELPPVPPFTQNSTLEPLLFAGQSYWLILSNSNTVFDSISYWPANSTGDVGPVLGGCSSPFSSGCVTTFTTEPAFEIDGTPVPEPSSFLFLGTGMAGLIALWRLRRRK